MSTEQRTELSNQCCAPEINTLCANYSSIIKKKKTRELTTKPPFFFFNKVLLEDSHTFIYLWSRAVPMLHQQSWMAVTGTTWLRCWKYYYLALYRKFSNVVIKSEKGRGQGSCLHIPHSHPRRKPRKSLIQMPLGTELGWSPAMRLCRPSSGISPQVSSPLGWLLSFMGVSPSWAQHSIMKVS